MSFFVVSLYFYADYFILRIGGWMKKRKKKNIDYYKYIFIVPIIVAFVLRKPSVFRVLLCLVGIGLFVYMFFKHKSKKMLPFIIIGCLFALVFLDGLFSLAFKRIPIFSYNITSLGDVKVYNSIGLRAWQCDKDNYKNIVVNTFDTKGYACDVSNITTVYSNTFLSTLVENYSDYKNQYVKINGKISKKNGLNYIEMQAYDKNSESLNGYVEFYTNITLRIIFDESKEELDNYDVYDNITVVGVIKNMEVDNNNYVVYMYEADVVSIKKLDNFSVSVTPDSKCDDKILLYMDTNNDVYQYCLLNIVVTYEDESKYDLNTVLSSGKMSIFDLINGYREYTKSDQDDSMLYKFDNYNILVCDEEKSNDVIIGSNKMNFNSVTCSVKAGID